jgi:hypothetical protein
MAQKEPKISKQATVGTTRDITLTIPQTLDIIRKLGNATCQSVIIAAYKSGLLIMYGTKRHKENLPVRT